VTHDHVKHNREFWDRDSQQYQAAHGAALRDAPLAWGAYRIAEAELGVLGATAGRELLELGCGAAQWSIALAGAGAQVVGLDLSRVQLTHARTDDANIPLVQASGEQLPFRNGAFDTVFCDHGAISFCEPSVIIPEAARVLRPNGLLAFCVVHPLLHLTWDEERQRQTRRLQLDYDDLGRMEYGEGTIDWALSAGQWIERLRDAGFAVERLLELRPPADLGTTYEEFAPPKWARRWPAEWIWVTRRAS
jgi:SAM-dependent methyltransferase